MADKNTVVAEPQVQEPSPGGATTSAGTITFYGEEPQETASVESTEEQTTETAGETPESEGTAVATPSDEAEVQPAASSQPEAQVAKEPATAPLPTREEIGTLQQTLQQQAAVIERMAAQIDAQQIAEAQRQLRTALEGQGYSEEQIQTALRQHADLENQKRQLVQDRQRMIQQLETQLKERDAKGRVAELISERTGMPFRELMQFSNPEIMEAKADAWQARQELAKTKLTKVKPTKVASVGPGQQGGTSRDILLRRYVAGESLTPEQKEIVFGNR